MMLHKGSQELFPNGVRARIVGFVYSWGRLSAIFTGFIVAYVLQHLGVTGVFVFFAAAMMVVVLTVGLMGPRTRDLPLEAISQWAGLRRLRSNGNEDEAVSTRRIFTMSTIRYDVLGLGNAIVDVIARAEEDFLILHGMRKGGMSLIDEARAAKIYDSMGPAIEVSGGSAANTMVGVAGFGARAAFVGRIKDDTLGAAFAHDIRASHVAFDTAPSAAGPSTGRCYVLVTPDGERTMNTYLGAAQDLHPLDIDDETVASAAVTYLEGYLWDPPHAKEAFRKAAAAAHKACRQVALTLSDAFCVDRWRGEFLHLLRSGTVDLLFANEAELASLYETGDFDTALTALRADARRAVVTRSAKGCVVIDGAQAVAVPAFQVERVVDSTGAGDLFAAGFLVGLARGFSDEHAARLGALAAAEVISHLGARPETSLRTLAQENGLLS